MNTTSDQLELSLDRPETPGLRALRLWVNRATDPTDHGRRRALYEREVRIREARQ